MHIILILNKQKPKPHSRTQISLDVTLLLGQYENKVLDGHKKEFDIGAFMCAQKVS